MPPVVVVGAGPAGSICAAELAGAGHEVVLLDRGPGRRPRVGETCGPRVAHLLGGGAHRDLEVFGSAWGSSRRDDRDLRFWLAGTGAVLDRAAFDTDLRDRAARAGADVRTGARVVAGQDRGADGWTLHLADGSPLTACVVVEATGRGARSRLLPDAGRIVTDALVCVVVGLPCGGADGGADGGALVESCEQGWWYTVALPDGTRTACLFTDVDLLPRPSARTAFLESARRATAHLRDVVGPIRDPGRVCDARTSLRRVQWRGGWLPVGDVAVSIDPLSGTGVERAVADGVAAAGAVSARLRGDGDRALRAHATARVEAFRDALAVQRRLYAREHRWPDAPFWSRRR